MDSHALYDRAADLQNQESASEKFAWYQHPLTQSLMLYLRARRENILEDWEDGVYTEATVEATAMKNASVLAEVRHIKDTLQYITEIPSRDEQD